MCMPHAVVPGHRIKFIYDYCRLIVKFGIVQYYTGRARVASNTYQHAQHHRARLFRARLNAAGQRESFDLERVGCPGCPGCPGALVTADQVLRSYGRQGSHRAGGHVHCGVHRGCLVRLPAHPASPGGGTMRSKISTSGPERGMGGHWRCVFELAACTS